ncbi:hypothetical protein G3480_26915 [Thiorhodococcus mannitoliphagus]|uniref:PIN-like domain-containing protein n=1 Tax=Thiorhodococcus mannitoliphagus TaxID=329406 RepID=A0A6P1E242_9GAMM|nr:PIN domain-containing protein [Thiorhodococcus mannitoliphagus]NEX23840.1 hypothetical protein [Thiorhodococcus mannitoliphagus]
MRHFLIDYESLQPPDLAGLQGEDVRVLIFVGAQQNRIPFDFANAMQQLGERARYVKISGAGRNALDFHLAFYLGEVVQKDPGGVFRIVSKDGGFDPLIAHLQADEIDVKRLEILGERPRSAEGDPPLPADQVPG